MWLGMGRDGKWFIEGQRQFTPVPLSINAGCVLNRQRPFIEPWLPLSSLKISHLLGINEFFVIGGQKYMLEWNG